MKRLLSIVLAAAMSVSLFGCSGGGGAASSAAPSSAAPSSEAASGEASSEAASSEASQPATISIWQTPKDVSQVTLDLQEGFKKAYPEITLNIIQTPKDADILSAMAAGNAPSILINGYPSFQTLIYQGAYLPIDDYIAKTPDFKNFETTQVETFALNGKHYGVPGGKYALAFQYHKSLFKAAGITEPPKTWDEFFEDCKKLTVPDKQQYGFALNGAQWAGWHFEMWVWGAGGDVTKQNDDGTLSLTFADPAAIKAAEFYRKLEKANVIQSDRNMQIDALERDFGQSKAAMIIGSLGDASGVTKNGGKPEDIGFFNFPAGPSGKGYNIDGGDGTGIVFTNDKNVADAAWKYIMFMNSKDAVTKGYKFKATQGPWVPIICPRTDIDMTQFGEVDPAVQKIVDEGGKLAKHEYYGKGAVGTFLDDAVAKIFGDTNTDIEKTLKDAEGKAKSAVDEFNAQIKNKK